MAKKESFYDWEQKFNKPKPKHKKEKNKQKKNLKTRLGIPEKQYQELMKKFRESLPDEI